MYEYDKRPFKVFADGWDIKHTWSMAEAIKEYEFWQKRGYDTFVYEVATGQCYRRRDIENGNY